MTVEAIISDLELGHEDTRASTRFISPSLLNAARSARELATR
jgi:hypothetical protein